MEFLKKYKIFESVGNDLEDILLEINDEVYWKAFSWKFDTYDGIRWVIIIQTVDEDEEYGLEGQLPLPIVIETIERSIDFMKISGFDNYQITFETDEEDSREKVDLNKVITLDVWPENFIRIEFWK